MHLHYSSLSKYCIIILVNKLKSWNEYLKSLLPFTGTHSLVFSKSLKNFVISVHYSTSPKNLYHAERFTLPFINIPDIKESSSRIFSKIHSSFFTYKEWKSFGIFTHLQNGGIITRKKYHSEQISVFSFTQYRFLFYIKHTVWKDCRIL